jgi:5'-nucleotidase
MMCGVEFSFYHSRIIVMNILVTNDDGVTHPALLALAQEMRKLGNVTVLAPDRNWSASGHVKTLHRPLRVKETTLADGTAALTSDGAPSDCVVLALLGLVQPRPELVVSGINPTANLGHDVTYSGTVTAAMEAAIWGLPAIAVSLDVPGEVATPDFEPAARAAGKVAQQVMARGLPKSVLLNVNVPYLPDGQIKGLQITRQGLRVYHDQLDMRRDPRGRPYYWIGGDAPSSVPEEGTDYGALSQGYVSITPLDLDLTAQRVVDELKAWDF